MMSQATNETTEPPSIAITDAAIDALKGALADADAGDEVHLLIDPNFNATMDIGPRAPDETAVDAGGFTILVDAATAARASGLRIDFVDTGDTAGFKIDNPNAPAKVREISAADLKAKLDSGEVVEFFDVRTEHERAIASIEGARLLDDAMIAHIESLDKATPIAFHCHHGMRSRSAATHFLDAGFRTLYNMSGGIDSWSLQVDSTVPRY